MRLCRKAFPLQPGGFFEMFSLFRRLNYFLGEAYAAQPRVISTLSNDYYEIILPFWRQE